MVVPILRLGRYLIASVQQTLTDSDFARFQTELADEVGSHRALGVLIDISSLDVLDSYATRTLQEMASIVKLRGAHMVIVGIQPAVAFATVQLGLQMSGTSVALDLDEGLEVLRETLESGHAGL
jgi:rsbT antagonist protein RsbS